MAQYPNPVENREELNLRLGIKSSLYNLRSIVASLYSLYIATNKTSHVNYTQEFTTSGITSLKMQDSIRKGIDDFFGESQDISSKIETTPLFKAQIEALQVGLELFFHLAKVSFCQSGLSERTGSNRYNKCLDFSTNLLQLDLLLSSYPESEVKEFLVSWIGEKTYESELENKVLMMLSVFSEDTQCKIRTTKGTEVYFQREGIYQLLTKGETVVSEDAKELVGPYRILKSYISSGMHPFIQDKNKVFQSSSDSTALANYAAMVSTMLDLSPRRQMVIQEETETPQDVNHLNEDHQPLQLISSDDPTKFVWSCIRLFNEKQDLKQLFTSKYKSLGGSIGNYIRINECYVAQIGKSDIKEIETIQIYDGSFLNAGFDARNIEQFKDAVNDEFEGRFQITISNEDGKSVYRLLMLKFAEDKYLPYLSALKTKPFMLLAGISGTGKSRIVRKLAQACWPLNSEQRKAQVPANFCMVQVKPNWHDSSELIGYVSRTSGESKFVVGDFLKFVAQAWENWLSEDKKPYFLCLDEMNLAPVEQYFAEYLSVLESRKYNAETGEITSDPIIKNDAEGYSDLLFKLGWKDQTMYDKLSENGICLPPNLIVVGTVNMDETTFSFSRKVLDRAMVIEMNEVNLNGGLRKGADEWDNVELSATDVLPQFVEGKDFFERNEDTCNSIIEKLGLINDILDGTPFKIAYRTRNEVLLYILNRMSKECSLEQALDEVVNMKILSRIEGDKNKVVDKEGNALLPKLIEVIKEVCGDNEKSPSLLKLEEMKKKLDKQFYCTYWN